MKSGYFIPMEWPSGLRRRLRRAPSHVRTRTRVAFFFGKSRLATPPPQKKK